MALMSHPEFPPKTIKSLLSKDQTKWPIELQTLKQEMKSDDYHATMRENNLVWFFDNRLWRELHYDAADYTHRAL